VPPTVVFSGTWVGLVSGFVAYVDLYWLAFFSLKAVVAALFDE
jgi:hypothetical protein